MNASQTDHDQLSVVLDILASAYRREALRSLLTGENNVASIEDLIDDLIDHDEIADERSYIAIQLHHVALPKLAGAGFIDYDVRTQTARVREDPPAELHALTTSGADLRSSW